MFSRYLKDFSIGGLFSGTAVTDTPQQQVRVYASPEISATAFLMDHFPMEAMQTKLGNDFVELSRKITDFYKALEGYFSKSDPDAKLDDLVIAFDIVRNNDLKFAELVRYSPALSKMDDAKRAEFNMKLAMSFGNYSRHHEAVAELGQTAAPA